MRRLFITCGMASLVLLATSDSATAQRFITTPAPPKRSDPPLPAPPTAPAPPAADRRGDHDRGPDRGHPHHHHSGQAGGWNPWSAYPLVWDGGYLPTFGTYYVPRYPVVQVLPYVNFIPQAQQATLPWRQPPAPAPAAAVRAARGTPKPTSAEQKAKAGKFIGYGDANFANQKYLSAIERYKTAARTAPDLAEPYMRQGHALVALGQYESAVKAFRRGLKLRDDWTDSPFRLDQLYAQDPLAKTSHLERLAKEIETNPLDADLLVALGVQLYFDGHADRAGVFFKRAAQLGGNEDRLLDDFLPKPAPAGAPQRPGAAGKIVF